MLWGSVLAAAHVACSTQTNFEDDTHYVPEKPSSSKTSSDATTVVAQSEDGQINPVGSNQSGTVFGGNDESHTGPKADEAGSQGSDHNDDNDTADGDEPANTNADAIKAGAGEMDLPGDDDGLKTSRKIRLQRPTRNRLPSQLPCQRRNLAQNL